MLVALGLVSVVATSARAQAPTVFAPAGAEWWFQTTDIGGPGYERCFVDSTFSYQGYPASRVRIDRYNGYLVGSGQVSWVHSGVTTEQLYFYVQGAQVYRFAPGGTAALQYDFSLPVGASWTVTVGCNSSDSTGVVTVDSAGTAPVSGQLLRYQYQSAQLTSGQTAGTNLRSVYAGRIWERLGYSGARFIPQPAWGNCEPTAYELLAYSDGTISFGAAPTIPLTAPDESTMAQLTVAPNPSADGRFTLHGLTAAVLYRIHDALGRQVSAGCLTIEQAVVELTNVPAGIYWLRGTKPGGASFTRRLIITRSW